MRMKAPTRIFARGTITCPSCIGEGCDRCKNTGKLIVKEPK